MTRWLPSTLARVHRNPVADYDPDLSEEHLGRQIFITWMPNSGSTFLKIALMALTGWQEVRLAYALDAFGRARCL